MWSGRELVAMLEDEHRMGEVVGMLSPDVVIRFVVTGDPSSNRGHDEGLRAFAEWLEPWAEYRQTAVDFSPDGPNAVLVRFEIAARGRTSGIETDGTLLQRYRVEGGRIAEIVEIA